MQHVTTAKYIAQLFLCVVSNGWPFSINLQLFWNLVVCVLLHFSSQVFLLHSFNSTFNTTHMTTPTMVGHSFINNFILNEYTLHNHYQSSWKTLLWLLSSILRVCLNKKNICFSSKYTQIVMKLVLLMLQIDAYPGL